MARIFEYTDYRTYLKDLYADLKKAQENFSYATLSLKVGGLSRAYLHRVFSGKQVLSKKTAQAIASALELKKRESAYFFEMIAFNRSRTEAKRQYHFERMLTFRRNDATTHVREDQFEYFSTWHIPVVREILATIDFKGDFEQIAEMIEPPITAFQVQKAIEVLENLEMVKKTPSGRYVVKQKHLITKGDFELPKILAVRKFQKDFTLIAADSIEKIKPEARDISTLTISISEEGFQKLRDEMNSFRERVVQIVDEDKSVDRVYQMNMHLFPVTKKPNKRKPK